MTPGSTSLADYMSGLYGAFGVMAALRHRDRTGEGQVIDVALYESVFRVLDELAPAYAMFGTVRGREGAGTANACPHGHFSTKDGRWVAIACTNDKMFARLCAAMERPDLAERYGNVRDRLAAREEVDRLVQEWTGARTLDEAMALCLREEVPCGPLNTIADIFADPHFRARGNLVGVEDTELGEVVVPNVLPRLSATPGSVRSLGPKLGDATEEILGAVLGLTPEEIAALRAEGVV